MEPSSILYLLQLGLVAVCLSDGAQDVDFCGSGGNYQGTSFRVKEPMSGQWSESHGCTCTVTTNSASTIYTSVNFKYEDGRYVSCPNQPMMRWNTLGGNIFGQLIYNCAQKQNTYPHTRTTELEVGSSLTFSLHNPIPVNAISEVYIAIQGSGGELTISCNKDQNPPTENSCICSNGTAIGGAGPYDTFQGDDTSLNQRLAVGFGVCIAFLVVVVIAFFIWFWLRRKQRKSEEKGKVPEGSENTGYSRSKDNLAGQPVPYNPPVSSNPDPMRARSGDGPYANIGDVNSAPVRRTPSQGSLTISETEGPIREDAPRKETVDPEERGHVYARPDKVRGEYQNAPVGPQQVSQFMGRHGSSDHEPYVTDSSREGPAMNIGPRGNQETNI